MPLFHINNKKMDTNKLAKVLTLSILLTVLCLPFGTVPLVFSLMATVNKNNPEIMEANLIKAVKWLKICGIAMVVLYIILIAIFIYLMQ